MSYFAANLARYRKERFLSLEALGKLVGTSKQVIWELESGWTEPTPAQLSQLAEVFGVSTDTLRRPPEESPGATAPPLGLTAPPDA